MANTSKGRPIARSIAEMNRNNSDIDQNIQERVKDLRGEGLTSSEISLRENIPLATVNRIPARTVFEDLNRKKPL